MAVLAVVLFHGGFRHVSGGYLGVDVFFVISGYLITRIIMREREAGQFSIKAFYLRRSRRILPALFLVILCSIPFGWMWMTADELAEFSASISAVCLFVSNVFFWQQTDYFAHATDLKPLVHAWSLSVEEQFYVLFPALVALTPKNRKGLFWGLAVATGASLILSAVAAAQAPAANFYLLPMRVWELGAGGLCCFARVSPGLRRDNLVSALGLATIAVAFVAPRQAMPVETLPALLPVLGTCALLLCAQPRTLAHGLLSLRPVTAIGLISYSVYLWHQPLFAFARIRSLTPPSQAFMLGLVAAALALAYVSWRFVEVPARRRAGPWSDDRSVAWGFAGMGAALVIIGLVGTLQAGFPGRWSAEVNRLSTALAPNYGLDIACEGAFHVDPRCATSREPIVVLWGDSFAMHLLDGLLASRPGLPLVQFTQSTCGPMLGIGPRRDEQPLNWPRQCIDFNDSVLAFIRKTPSLRYAVLASPFGQYANAAARVVTRDGSVVAASTVASAALRRTVLELKALGIRPVVFAPPPRPGFDAGHCVLRARQFGEAGSVCDFALADSLKRQAAVRALLQDIATDVDVIWLDSGICEEGLCRASRDGVSIYRDDGHLSHEGSRALGREMDFFRLIRGPD